MSSNENRISKLIEQGYRYDCEGYNLSGRAVVCYRNFYTGHEIQIPKEDMTLENHENVLLNKQKEEIIKAVNKTLTYYGIGDNSILRCALIGAIEGVGNERI